MFLTSSAGTQSSGFGPSRSHSRSRILSLNEVTAMMDRRLFLKTAAAAVPAAHVADSFGLRPAIETSSASAASPAADADVPWQKTLRRIGQTNMTEHDP